MSWRYGRSNEKSLASFMELPDSYIVLDTETTGLPDNEGMPGFDWPIVTFHIERFDLKPLEGISIFCSQKSVIDYAAEEKIEIVMMLDDITSVGQMHRGIKGKDILKASAYF